MVAEEEEEECVPAQYSPAVEMAQYLMETRLGRCSNHTAIAVWTGGRKKRMWRRS